MDLQHKFVQNQTCATSWKSVTRCFVDWLSETTTFDCKSLTNAEYDDTGILNVYPVVCVKA